MKKNYLIFVFILIALLTLTLSGCGREEQSLEGLYVTTFELEGGTLETPTSSVATRINYAYNPGTYVLDPTTLNGYKLTRTGYVFTGWYTDKECTPSSKWDFKTLLNQEELTLYAGWKKAIKISYTVFYLDENGEKVSLGSYDVSGGDKFDDWRNLAKKRTGYTPLGYYSDPEFTTSWDFDYTHPGSDIDLDVPVYVKYIEGVWTFVDNLYALKNAVSANENIYLTADINCEGAKLSFSNYGGEINGNGFTVSNFQVPKSGTIKVSCAIFSRLADGTVIRDINFTEVVYDLSGVVGDSADLKIAALAITSAGDLTLSGVTVEGTLITGYTGEISDIEMVYETKGAADVTNSSCNVTIVNN